MIALAHHLVQPINDLICKNIRILQEYLANIFVIITDTLDVTIEEQKLLQITNLITIQITCIESMDDVCFSSVHYQTIFIQHLGHQLIKINYACLVLIILLFQLLDVPLEFNILLLSLASL